jgi:hypothetical protein
MMPTVPLLQFAAALLFCLRAAAAFAAPPVPSASASASSSASASASAASERPPLDIEALKKSLRDDRELFGDTPAPAPALFSASPPRNKRFEEHMRRAIPRDCRTAYAGLGPLAIYPLLFSTVTGIGCKW